MVYKMVKRFMGPAFHVWVRVQVLGRFELGQRLGLTIHNLSVYK